MSEGFDEIMANYSPKVQDLAMQARTLIRGAMPDVVEVAWVQQRILGYGVGPKKMSEQFCYIAPHVERINLGFYYGSELPDPEGLLEGTGKLMRHVKIRTPEELQNPALRRLLHASTTHRMPAKPSRT